MTGAARPGPLPAGIRHRAAVLGSPIQHSLSPVLHRAAYSGLGLADWAYDRFEVAEDQLAEFLDTLDESWAGLSLTMPLKRIVFELADEVSQTAQAVGAANTLLFDVSRRGAGGRVHRRIDNTDVAGIVGALGRGGVDTGAGSGSAGTGPDGAGRAVVLGGGATAASAVAALHRLGRTEVTVCVRSVQRAADVLAAAEALGVRAGTAGFDAAADLLAEADVVVSTVPGDALGQLAGRLAPVPNAVLLDVVYHPWPTQLTAAWRTAGGQVVSGRDMLLFQAVDQVRLMTGQDPDVALMEQALTEASSG